MRPHVVPDDESEPERPMRYLIVGALTVLGLAWVVGWVIISIVKP